jgi:hypothetical protein
MPMKTFATLLVTALLVAQSGSAQAAKKKKRAPKPAPEATSETSDTGNTKTPSAQSSEDGGETGSDTGGQAGGEAGKAPLNFDFFGDKAAGHGAGGTGEGAASGDVDEVESKASTRRWMLKTHQTLGVATWLLLASTVIVGQLNYNQLYGGGGGSSKWQTPHRYLVVSTSIAFAGTGTFAIFAPNPYPKPLHFDTGLVHRMAVIGATLGMLAEGYLGWVATHEANAGNPQSRTMARAHQAIGYTTLGFLTIAGTVWLF